MATLAEIMARKAGNSQASVSSGIKITPESEKVMLAASLKKTLDASAPKPLPQLPFADQRELGAIVKGERIPMNHPPEGSPDADWDWFDALHSFSSDLGIIIDPKKNCAWLALRANPTQQPLLLHRLPLFNRVAVEGDPF